MYFCPASLASLTIASALNEDGLNAAEIFSYSAIGMLQPLLIHSAFLHTVPSGRVYWPSSCE